MPANTRRMALTNNATEVVTKPDDSEEIISKADELISSLAMRKNGVTSLLEGMALQDWGVIRNHSICPDESGIIPTNTVLNIQRQAVEPVLQQFSEDLEAIKTKVTHILSDLSEDEPDDSMFIPDPAANPTPAMKVITIIQVIQSMSKWSSDIMDTWVNYHMNRDQLKGGIDIQRLMTEQNFVDTDDICQAIVLLDCKMAKEMKTMLNTIMLNYITLEDIVLDATGKVAETPNSPGYSSLYV